jgi:hypothetical protein
MKLDRNREIERTKMCGRIIIIIRIITRIAIAPPHGFQFQKKMIIAGYSPNRN